MDMLSENGARGSCFEKFVSLGTTARCLGFASKRPWPAPEGSGLARVVVQGLVRTSGVGAPEWWLGEDLATGVTRPPPFGCGCELVLTPLFQTSNVLCTSVFNLLLFNLLMLLLSKLGFAQSNHTALFW